jgi:Fic family protein
MTLDELRASVAARRAELDDLRPLRGAALEALRFAFDVELTWSSNAIEGNTLTHGETAQLIEHGITVGGKRLRDHLEAEDLYAALQWMREIAATDVPVGEAIVTELHRRIVARSRPDIAGMYTTQGRRIAGSAVVLPNPLKIPDLMQAFGTRLSEASSEPEAAFRAHFDLVAIHPFSDGNGRTARLLMNLMLIRGGWPPLAVRPNDRNAYIAALEAAHMTGDLGRFQAVMHERLEATLRDYVGLLSETIVEGDTSA